MNDRFMTYVDEIYNLKDPNGNEFSYAFHALPLRANLEYYKVIKVPMSYSKVKMAAKHKRYTHPQAFINDLAQITWNARFFNEESSDFYKFALILDDFVKQTILPDLRSDAKIYKHETLFYPNLGALPNELNNGNGTDETDRSSLSRITKSNEQPHGSANAAKSIFRNNAHQKIEENEETKASNGNESHQRFKQERVNDLGSGQGVMNSRINESLNGQERDELEYRNITSQSYNANTYVATVEDTGKPHIYVPPKNVSNQAPNTQVLEQWVKRGRPPIVDKPHEQRIKSIMRGLKKIKVGNKTIVSFWDKLPSQQDHPDYLRVVKDPITMLDIKGLIKQRYYKTVDAYVADVFKLINNNRNYFIHDEFIKNNLNILEANISRLYQIEMSKPDVEYMTGQQTTRFPLSQAVFEGRTYKVGNWVLVKNSNDPLRPIVGQIFRLWQQEDGVLCMNVCWYYRPEWTVHRCDRLFLENEVVKTGQYRDHLVSEIVGPCYVAYFTRWLKGDPGIPYEGPLFVCEFRYNDRENTFAKIRTWKACLPDEVRHLEDPIKPLSGHRVLKKFPSPIKNLLLPGSTSTSPIPQPIILNLNSPPLVGSVYVPRVNDEVDPHYFDNSLAPTQCKSYIPPTTNIRIPSSAIVDNYNSINTDGNESTPEVNHGHESSLNINISTVNSMSKLGLPGTSTIDISGGLNSGINLINRSQHNISTTFKSYSKPNLSNTAISNTSHINMSVPHIYPGSHKVIKSPYNLTSYSFSQFHSPSNSYTFVRNNGGDEVLNELVKNSYLTIDRGNYERMNRLMKQSSGNSGSGESNNVERNALVWFRGPPLNVVDRVLSDSVRGGVNNGSVGVKRVRCGHSVEYLAWKLKKQKQNEEENNAMTKN